MSTRRMKKGKNLEMEVESIFFQDENDDSKAILQENLKTAKSPQSKNIFEVTTPRRDSQAVLQDIIQTPRRSCRKSAFKPAQDYDDIVKRSLRSCTRSNKQTKTENDENNDDVNVVPRWTPAKVGRVSQKRGRKSKRVDKGKNQNDKITDQKVGDTYGDKEGSSQQNNVLGKAEEVSDIFVALNENLNQTDQMKESDQGRLNKQEDKENPDSIVNNDASFKTHNQSVDLLQEDSEDDHESTEKSESEEICIIYENNISNENETHSRSSKNIASVNKEDSFGCYLKSREINLSDLGLNPISHEEGKDETNLGTQIKILPKEVEEMPSLIICDDADDAIDSKETRTMNETFEADENVEIKDCQKQDGEIMEILQLSDDDCETPKKCPQIILPDKSAQNRNLLSNNNKTPATGAKIPSTKNTPAENVTSTIKQSIKGSAIKAKLPSTPKAFTPKFPRTPQQSKKPYRTPTPYIKRNFKLNDETKENIQKTPNKDYQKTSLGYLTTLEPREIVLRGIRKRSLSICIDGKKRQNLLVTPTGKQKQARVVSFHSPANQTAIIDDLDKIIAKSIKKRKVQEKDTPKKFVTTRKRSLSLDESSMSSSIASKLPRPVLIQNETNKMKNPISSKALKRTKLPNFAAIHEKHFDKMENLVDHVSRKQERSKNLINSATKFISASAQKNISLNKSINNKTAEKPRALKKINLNPSNLKKIEKTDLNKKLAMTKRPPFNLSTSVIVKPTTSASNFVEKANTSRIHNDSKMDSRLQRHMELFKGRAASAKTNSASRKNEVVLKGVRSNRRFELQMQHRKNLQQ